MFLCFALVPKLEPWIFTGIGTRLQKCRCRDNTNIYNYYYLFLLLDPKTIITPLKAPFNNEIILQIMQIQRCWSQSEWFCVPWRPRWTVQAGGRAWSRSRPSWRVSRWARRRWAGRSRPTGRSYWSYRWAELLASAHTTAWSSSSACLGSEREKETCTGLDDSSCGLIAWSKAKIDLTCFPPDPAALFSHIIINVSITVIISMSCLPLQRQKRLKVLFIF